MRRPIFYRVVLLLEYLNRHQNKKLMFADIVSFLRTELDEPDLNERTVQRTIQFINDELGISLTNKDKRGYKLIFDDGSDLESQHRFSTFWGLLSRINMVGSYFLNNTKGLDIDIKDFNETNWKIAKEILPCIWNKITIKINHRTYDFPNGTVSLVSPLLIVQRLGKWYLLALRKGQFRFFGLDRILQVEKETDSFSFDGYESIKYRLDRMIGLFNFDKEVEVLKLRFSQEQLKYELAAPWIADCQILEGPSGQIFCYNIIINYELKRKILSYGNAVEVLEPEYFRQEIIHALGAATRLYQTADDTERPTNH